VGSTVINMSIRGLDYTAIIDAVFSRIYNNDLLLVAAAGNGGPSAKVTQLFTPQLLVLVLL
jgi:subtilisin family serine protease